MNLSRNWNLSFQDLNFQGESGRDSTVFDTSKERTNHLMAKWNLTNSVLCEGDGMIQAMEHFVKVCSTHYFPGDMNSLHDLEEDAMRWLTKLEKEV